MKSIGLAVALALALWATTGVSAARVAQIQRQTNRQQQMTSAVMQGALDAIAAQSDPAQLVFRKDVQHDLQMDLGQRNKLDNFHDRQLQDLQQTRMQSRRNQTAVTDLLAKQKQETLGKIDGLLTDRQKGRLKQVVLQIQGDQAILSKDIQKQLGFTNEQLDRIRQAKSQRDAQLADLQANIQQGAVQRQEVVSRVQEMQTGFDGALADILTQEQADQLKKLLGPPFKAS